MISNTKSSDSFDEAIKQLDISDIAFDDDGIINFYWPLDNKKSAQLMKKLTDDLIPYVTKNERELSELVAVRLFFKWFICEILRIFEATVIAEECKKDGIRPLIPGHYKKLDAAYHSNSLECKFFLNHSSGPSYGRKIPKTLKRFGKEFLWNGLKIGIFRKYGSNSNDILAISPSNLAIKHAKGAKKLLRYSGFNEWFGAVPKEYITKKTKGLVANQTLLNIIELKFNELGYDISFEFRNYLETWLCQANNFASYYLSYNKQSLEDLYGEVWFGCGGSSMWHVMLIEKLRRNNIKVVTHDHGSGNSHHEQTPVHWVEYMHTDKFVTFNNINEINRSKQFRKKLIFGQKPPSIVSLESALGIRSIKPNSMNVKVSKKIKKIMYVGTAFHGEGARLRPIFHDMTYFDWQIKLFSHLKKLNMDVIYKPHPEGATRVPYGFAETFGFVSTTKKFEDINIDVDAYIIDFIFSTTTPLVLKTKKPVFFVNLGFPELLPDALKLIKKRCYYFEAEYSAESRLNIDFDEFTQLINNEEHKFNTSFPDIYFANV
jgi:hypothetical protein